MSALLFYSNKCEYCQQLLKTIKDNHLTGFKFIDVDKIRVPDSITQVPTLAIKSYNKPLVGKQVFDWIESQDYFNQITNNIKTRTSNKQPVVDNSLAYSKLKKSDNFTSLDEKQPDETIHVDVNHGYNFGVLKSYKDNNN
uniref:Glutaredoxin domain-containing protein n=1 Tax=viral metagenome TaxID=1070528 RepID=A0A6C0LYQ3_9ZZZZ